MNWTEPRKSYKSTEQGFSASKKIQTTCLNTPIFDKEYKSCKYQQSPSHQSTIKIKNCPYHFNNQQHVCLTCRKSICLRCAITYCQNHLVKSKKQIIPVLIQDLQKIYIQQTVNQVQTKLSQSLQRQDYFQNKILKLIQNIEENFNAVIQTLKQKKLQIISYYDQQFEKYLNEYQSYDDMLKKKLQYLSFLEKQCLQWKSKSAQIEQKVTIQKIDEITHSIKQNFDTSKNQKALSTSFISKNKITLDKIWSEQKLQKILYEIENIDFKFKKDNFVSQIKVTEKKKRVQTQSSDYQNKIQSSAHKSPGIKNTKASGRHIYNKFNTGRKNKEERLQKSQLI